VVPLPIALRWGGNSIVTIETNFNFFQHAAATAGGERGATSRGGWAHEGDGPLYMQRMARLRLILLAAIAAGCAASILSGLLTAFTLSAG
jgi:hypothetical protein